MIVFVDLEHKWLRQEPELWQFFATKTVETKYRLEEISGQLCLILHYERLSPALLAELKPRAVIVSGNYTGYQHYGEAELAGLRAVYREAAWPMLTFCGGFHFLAQTYGAKIRPMETLPDDTPDSPPGTPLPLGWGAAAAGDNGPERKQEVGFMPVRLSRPHPLFEGLEPQPLFYQQHAWEVKSLPDAFQILAESDLCPVQIIAHKEKPIFGTQFHCELFDAAHPAGQQLLKNFFKLAMGQPPSA